MKVKVKFAQSCLTLCNLMDSSSPGSSVLGASPGNNTGVSCHALLQGIFLNQVLNLCLLYLLHWPVRFFTTSSRDFSYSSPNLQVPKITSNMYQGLSKYLLSEQMYEFTARLQ